MLRRRASARAQFTSLRTPRPQRCRRGRCARRPDLTPLSARRQSRAEYAHEKSSSSSANPKIFHCYQSVPAIAQIVDAARSSHYGPRGLEGAGNRNRKRRAGVMTMSDKARGGKEPDMPDTEEAALSARLRSLGDRLGSQRPTTPPTSREIGRVPTPRDSRADFVCAANSWPVSWSGPRSGGRSIGPWAFRRGE